MKKFLVAAVMVLGVASFAMAQHGWGHGYGHGNGGGYGNGWNCGGPCYNGNGQMMRGGGMGMGPGYNRQAPESAVKNADEAKAKVQEVINNNFKGYKIGKVETIQVPRGTVYEVNVTDAGGNQFVFHVNPWGRVMGPMANGNPVQK